MAPKLIVFLLIFFLSFTIIPSEVIAQGTDSANLKTKPPIRPDIVAEKQKLQEERMTIYKDARKDMIASREAYIERMQQLRETAKEKFQVKREAFQEKIATIKDEQKRQIIERIDTKLTTVNTNRTTQMSQNLEKLSGILARIQEKTTAAKADGKNTSSVDISITKAETAIQNAKTVVEAQLSKEYVITITSTGSGQLKNSVGTTTKQLQADLSDLHKLMVAAKQAVQQAHMALARVLGAPVTPAEQ